MSKKLAFMTVGLLHEPVGHPRVQGFVDRIPAVYDAVDESDGFSARSERVIESWTQSWGEVTAPRCYGADQRMDRIASTLSLWDDLESVAAFAYHGAHGEAMAKRKEWFQSHELPTYVAWWVEAGDSINWSEASERLDHLHEIGASVHAFNFINPFDSDGRPCRLNAKAVRGKIAMNANS